MRCQDCCKTDKSKEYLINNYHTQALYVRQRNKLATSDKEFGHLKTSLKNKNMYFNLNRVGSQKQVANFSLNHRQAQYIINSTLKSPQRAKTSQNQQHYILPSRSFPNYIIYNDSRLPPNSNNLAQISTPKSVTNFSKQSSNNIQKKQKQIISQLNNRFPSQTQLAIKQNSQIYPQIGYQRPLIKINGIKYINNNFKRQSVLEQIIQEEFKNDLKNIYNQNAGKSVSIKGNEQNQLQPIKQQNLLKPQENMGIFGSRAFRTQVVGHIQNINCTKTQSIKDSKSQTSEFSQIVTNQLLKLKTQVTKYSTSYFVHEPLKQTEMVNQQQLNIKNRKEHYRKASNNF